MLKFICEEWNNQEDSLLFKGLNSLHPKSGDFDKVKSNIKREILSHNSKH